MSFPLVISYLDFDVLHEPWNRYRVSDGSMLYSRVIVVQIVKPGQYDIYGKPQYGILANNLSSLRAPKELRGSPTLQPPSAEQLGNYIVEDVNIEPISEDWSSYRCADGTTIKVKGFVTSIKRTSVYDGLGEPLYIINTQNIIKDDVPKNLWRKL